MKHLINFTIFTISLFIIACTGDRAEKSKVEKSEANQIVKSDSPATKVNVSFNVNGINYVIDNMSNDSSFVMFYTEESDMNHDADLKINSIDKDKGLTIIIDGLQGKGKESMSGTVRFEDSSSLVTFKEGDLQINFTEGDLEIEDISKKSGRVKLKANGKCTVKKGNSFKDMKVDVPAQLNFDATFTNVKTSDYKK